jgi:hypothetical protein
MKTIADILEKARQRAKEMDLPYKGALLPVEAYQLLMEVTGAKLVDVRSQAELDWVGRIPGAIEIELRAYPQTSAKLSGFTPGDGRSCFRS